MLRCLHIANLAIVRDLTLDLGEGLTLLTGETGAGKSILVDGLALVLGGRSGPEMLRAGAERASVEAEFDVTSSRAARAFLEERGYAHDGGRIVARREILAQGRGRSFLGGSLAPLSDLKDLGARLVDLHGQHQQQTLLHAASHRDLLDRQAGLDARLDDMARAAQALSSSETRLRSLREGAQRLLQRADLLRHLVAEIERAAPRAGEREGLRSERELLRNAETILRQARAAYEALYEGESSSLSRLAESIRALRDLGRFDPALHDSLERAEAARADLQEIAFALRDYPSRLSFEPHRLEAIDDRLQLLETLLRKHAPGGAEEDLLRLHDEATAELEQLVGGGETVEDLEARVETLRGEALRVATDLSLARREAAQLLERKVERELRDLGMPARFSVERRTRPSPGSGLWVEGEEVVVDAAGYDVVEFRLSANPGEPLAPLAAVASGGELSRVMLALEVVLRRDAEPRLLVFDEVDAGIGGAVAEAVGRKLSALARHHQVMCVTHLPQIAAHADRHVLVRKRAARGRAEVEIDTLDDAGKVRELARMLAGEKVTPAALRHAQEMRARGRPCAGPEAGT